MLLTGVVMPLILGLAVFLFGMKIMELALHRWAGPYLKGVLARLTRTPLRGMVTGTVITAILQSSSALTVITIGLVNAGVLNFSQTLGVILGTNIGTCLTTELIGLNINQLGVPLLIGATALWMLTLALPLRRLKAGTERIVGALRCLAAAAAGFSCVLIGMEIMADIVPALQKLGFFSWFIELSQKSLLWGVLAGACLTAIIQSSSAAIAIAMGLAAVQAISVELGIAITLGANIGTCITGFIASIGGSKYGQYVAWSHMILNIGGALLFLPFIHMLESASAIMTPKPAAQLAHAQTLFNLVCSIVALPFCYLPFFKRSS